MTGPSYPNAVPTIATLTGTDYPQSSHLNAPNREIEAIAAELGRNIATVDDTVVPVPSPLTVSALKDMLAYIFKTWAGASNWYSAGVASRGFLAAHGGAAVVPSGGSPAAVRIYFFGNELDAVDASSRLYLPFACKVVTLKFQIITAQPGTGSLVATLLKNGASQAITATHAAGAVAMSVASGAGSVSYSAEDYLHVLLTNNAATDSGQIGSVTLEFNQTG